MLAALSASEVYVGTPTCALLQTVSSRECFAISATMYVTTVVGQPKSGKWTAYTIVDATLPGCVRCASTTAVGLCGTSPSLINQ